MKLQMLKSLSILIIFLLVSRFTGISNFSPLFAFAIYLPRLTDNVLIQYFLPLSIIVFTNLFLEPVNILVLTIIILIFLITPFISKRSKNLFWGCINTMLAWYLFVNGAVWFSAGGSLIEVYIAAIPFDIKLSISTALYLFLFSTAERFWTSFFKSDVKILDR